jgi:CRISPR/Cas system CSM-associated protein Csm3 (group 7 of RAMP superfamily)
MTAPPAVWVDVDVRLIIQTTAALHVGSGYSEGLSQKGIVRAPDETSRGHRRQPYIPGSSLKGRVRNLCEDLARQFGLEVVCGVPRVAETGDRSIHRTARCIICRIFGNIGDNSPEGRCLRWENAYPVTGEREVAAQTSGRTHVQLSRVRGTSAAGRLFTAEFAAPGLTFAGRVVGSVRGTEWRPGSGRFHEVALLFAGLALIDSLGGMRRRGAGSCRVLLPEIISVVVGSHAVAGSLGDLLDPLGDLQEFDPGGDGLGA